MKRITLLLAAVLTASCVMAQPKFGVQAGLNLSNYWGSAAPESTKKPGIRLGVVMEKDDPKLDNLSMQMGFLFVQQGGKTELEGLFGRKTNTEMTVNYLQLPVNIRYNIEIGGNMGLFLQTGIYTGYAISGKQKTDGESVNINFEERNMTTFDAGFGLGAGLKIMDNIQVGLSKNWGFFPISKGTATGKTPKFYNSNLALTATYMFGK